MRYNYDHNHYRKYVRMCAIYKQCKHSMRVYKVFRDVTDNSISIIPRSTEQMHECVIMFSARKHVILNDYQLGVSKYKKTAQLTFFKRKDFQVVESQKRNIHELAKLLQTRGPLQFQVAKPPLDLRR